MNYIIIKNDNISAKEIEILRTSVGWDITPGQTDKALKQSYCFYSVRDKVKLVAFLRIISDGIADAFIVDFIVHPDYQKQGIGKEMIQRVLNDFKDVVQCVQATFNPENEEFYRKAGLHIFRGGFFDYKTMNI